MEVDKSINVLLHQSSVLWVALCQFLEAPSFVGRVVDEDRTIVVWIDDFTHPLNTCQGRILASQIQKFFVLEHARGLFDMA